MENSNNDPVLAIISSLTSLKLSGARLDVNEIAKSIPASMQFDPRLPEWITDNTKITASEFKKTLAKAVHQEKVAASLGRVPKTTNELVTLYVEKHAIVCQYDGTIRKTKAPVMRVGKEDITVTQADIDADPTVKLWHTVYHNDALTTLDIERGLRIITSELALRFSRDEITDAVFEWYAQARKDRLLYLLNDVGPWPVEGAAKKAAPVWNDVALKCFDCSETSPEFVIAAIQKFIHQVKRKMLGLPIFDHLMLVLLGPQGAGKSSFVKALFSPLKELAIETTFKQVEDDRNIDIWNNFILFLDEMGHAARADIEAIKHAVTADNLTRRPMRQNNVITVQQKGTFIGCSNKELGQLIKDATGIRRFLALRFLGKDKVDWLFINQIDWPMLWESVDPYGECPMTGFTDVLADVQEETRERGRVETWLGEFSTTDIGYGDHLNARGRISSAALYDVFRFYEDRNYPGTYKHAKTEFDHEMKRLRNNKPECMIFERQREKTGWYYRFEGRVHGSEPDHDPKVVQMTPRSGVQH